MSVFYRLHQDQSVGTKRSGKWYARMVPTSCINTRQLAEIQLEGCPLGKGVHRGRQHQGHAHRVHPRAQYGRCRQPREAVPAGSEVRGVA